MARLVVACGCLLLSAGCAFLPEISRQPNVYNPFPQLTKVAVAPFFNLTTDPAVDGRQFALAYFSELQNVPGFEVVPVGVVELKLREHNLELTGPLEARKLAQLLQVDAVVVGAVTDFTPYYPPRCALQVEWYVPEAGYHPIPPGYGLPWGTPQEEQIPPALVFEAERALARAQMATQNPLPAGATEKDESPQQEPSPESGAKAIAADTAARASPTVVSDPTVAGLPPDWPDPRGFAPPPPSPYRPTSQESYEPVLQHTKTYNGNDPYVTEALTNYAYFQDDARFGGWQSYLQRSDDFIRFCCHMHIAEMLTARGGAGETRVVIRWPTDR